MLSNAGTLAAPFPYFGGKSGACDQVWRAFGAVYKRLIADGVIRFDGYAPRVRGHGSPGPKYVAVV